MTKQQIVTAPSAFDKWVRQHQYSGSFKEIQSHGIRWNSQRKMNSVCLDDLFWVDLKSINVEKTKTFYRKLVI